MKVIFILLGALLYLYGVYKAGAALFHGEWLHAIAVLSALALWQLTAIQISTAKMLKNVK